MSSPRAARPTPGLVTTVASSVAMVAVAFLPWAASGRATRTSFELVQTAERLDLLEGAARQVLATGWFLAPVAVAGVWLAAFLGRRVIAGILAGLVAAFGVALAAAVRASPLGTEVGAWCGIAAAAGIVAGIFVMVIEHRRTR